MTLNGLTGTGTAARRWGILGLVAAATILVLLIAQVHANAPSSAAPAPSGGSAHLAAAPLDKINYLVQPKKDRVLVSVDAGSLRVFGDQLQLVEPRGKVVASVPLRYQLGAAIYSLGTVINGRTAQLVAAPASLPSAGRVAADTTTTTVTFTSTSATPPTNEADAQADRIDKAFTRMGTELTLTMAIVTSLGTIVVGGLGCLIGLAAGCLPGLVAGATMGAVAGSVVIGGIGAIVALGIFAWTMSQPMQKPKKSAAGERVSDAATPSVQAAH